VNAGRQPGDTQDESVLVAGEEERRTPLVSDIECEPCRANTFLAEGDRLYGNCSDRRLQCNRMLVGATGLEPATSGVTGQH
jgi:hypothetical protein